MPKPPITRKPIPRTVAGWESEALGIWSFLERLSLLEPDNGQAWVDAQASYSKKRLADLVDNMPRGARAPHPIRQWRKGYNP